MGKPLNASGPMSPTERQRRWRARLKQRKAQEQSQPTDPLVPLIKAWNAASEADQIRFIDIIYGRLT